MRKLLFAAAVSLAALAGCSKSSSNADESAEVGADLPKMTVDEVETAINAKQAVAVDCNRETTRKKNGVVPGAILVSSDDNYAASELPADKSTKLVFYCSNSG
jgi:tRNA pseudouridine-54 N-methylase